MIDGVVAVLTRYKKRAEHHEQNDFFRMFGDRIDAFIKNSSSECMIALPHCYNSSFHAYFWQACLTITLLPQD